MRHFKISEFASPDELTSSENMDPVFLEMIDQAREIAGIPFFITSGFRTVAHSRDLVSKGYPVAKHSAHLTGHAADIKAVTSRHRFRIITALLEAKFERIGIGPDFVHCDNSPTKAGRVIWTY